MGKPASRRICRSSRNLPSLKTADLPIKQARIEPEKAKEELKPFQTNFGTGQRALTPTKPK
jgi:hypothetical protein